MKITNDSHLDHELTFAHVDFVRKTFGDREGFFIETVDLPESLSSLPCSLHGPIVGDAPVEDGECEMVVRGARPGPSRLCRRPVRQSRKLTVIAGPHEGQTILYTAFGGPAAPREPHDPSLSGEELIESRLFWSMHALSRGDEK